MYTGGNLLVKVCYTRTGLSGTDVATSLTGTGVTANTLAYTTAVTTANYCSEPRALTSRAARPNFRFGSELISVDDLEST